MMFFDILNWVWCLLKSFFFWVIETFLGFIDTVASFVLGILPDTPFKFDPIEWGTIGNSIGYFIPIQQILNHFITILAAISLYFGVRYLLRLIKMVG